MKVLTSTAMTATNSLRIETIRRYVLEKIYKFIIASVIKFCRFSIYYGAFIAHTDYPHQ